MNRDEAGRLEQLWGGDFGDDYSRRNAEAAEGRQAFWSALMQQLQPTSVLEVGSNVGGNLRWVADHVDRRHVVGIDVNEGALRTLRRSIGVGAVRSVAKALPFADGTFDLTFTAGVLIHQPPETLPDVMSELVRCSGRYVLCAEYHADEPTEVHYRGMERALWKRDFGGDYLAAFPALQLVDSGFLPKGEGSWDDVTWWAMRKS